MLIPQKQYFRAQCLFCKGKKCPHEQESGAVHTSHTVHGLKGLNSHWVSCDIIASQRPSNRLIEKYDLLKQFKENRVVAIINLQEAYEHPMCGDGILTDSSKCSTPGFSYDPEIFMKHSIRYYNFPIQDMECPSFQLLVNVMHVLHGALNHHKNSVLIHCHSGYGRTGAIIACYLLWDQRMKNATDAIEYVRRRRPKSIQTPSQVKMIHRFERYLKDLWKVFVLNEDEEQATLNIFREHTAKSATHLSAPDQQIGSPLSSNGYSPSKQRHIYHDDGSAILTSPSKSTPKKSIISKRKLQLVKPFKRQRKSSADHSLESTPPKRSQRSDLIKSPQSLRMTDYMFVPNNRNSHHRRRKQPAVVESSRHTPPSQHHQSSMRRSRSQSDIAEIDKNNSKARALLKQESSQELLEPSLPIQLDNAENPSVFRKAVLPCVSLATLKEKQATLLCGSEARLLSSLPKAVFIICNNLRKCLFKVSTDAEGNTLQTTQCHGAMEEFVSSLNAVFSHEACSDDILRKVLFLKRKINGNHWSVLESCEEGNVLCKLLIDFFDQLKSPVVPKDFVAHHFYLREKAEPQVESKCEKSAEDQSSEADMLSIESVNSLSSAMKKSSTESESEAGSKCEQQKVHQNASSAADVLKNLVASRYEIVLCLARLLHQFKIDDTKVESKRFCILLGEKLTRSKEGSDFGEHLLLPASRDESFVRKTIREVSNEKGRRASLLLRQGSQARISEGSPLAAV